MATVLKFHRTSFDRDIAISLYPIPNGIDGIDSVRRTQDSRSGSNSQPRGGDSLIIGWQYRGYISVFDCITGRRV